MLSVSSLVNLCFRSQREALFNIHISRSSNIATVGSTVKTTKQ